MKVLMTGATGFIGGHLIQTLSPNHELVCLVSDERKTRPLSNVEWVVQDLESPLNESNIPSHIEAIIHLAQSRHYREFPEKTWDIFQVNLRSTLSLLEFGRRIGIQRFIYASSGGIYGYSYEKFMETDATNPVNFYLTSKYCSELLIGNYHSYFDTVVFRFFFVYGPNQQSMLVPRLIQSIQHGEPVIIFGKHGVRINPIHVRDAVKVFQPVIDNPISGIFNVAGDEVVSIKELADTMGKLIGKEPKFIYEKSHVPGDIIGDNSRMKTVLGAFPEISLKAGISEMIQIVEKERVIL